MEVGVTKRCDGCNRPALEERHGTVEPSEGARIVKVEASGNVVATCGCGRRVVWYRVRRRAAVITTS